jgi:hypothetical protein
MNRWLWALLVVIAMAVVCGLFVAFGPDSPMSYDHVTGYPKDMR